MDVQSSSGAYLDEAVLRCRHAVGAGQVVTGSPACGSRHGSGRIHQPSGVASPVIGWASADTHCIVRPSLGRVLDNQAGQLGVI
jgi:hypothetical protein